MPAGPPRASREVRGRRDHMSGVYKKIDIVGTSPTSFAEATRVAVAEASKSVRHMSWFEVVEQRGAIKDDKVLEFQVTLRIGFKIEY
jgi:flavin-binding protein dodecin